MCARSCCARKSEPARPESRSHNDLSVCSKDLSRGLRARPAQQSLADLPRWLADAWKAPTQGMSDENHGANGHVDNVHGYVVEHNRAHGSLSEDVTDTYHRTHPGSL